ncbi:uncharacterized protein CIMG_13014 [Coccidioides immitis RS]|uniref:Uncharacterized protein n=1 Tax=Coccidioides immitis (strain RS) TaxID=246410 RepID=A0A0D8JT83_COCIM|nr:uncharacterized protein CIMG_13014 [Coccidioides immitis RS]KJF60507.1 hypothetical protein CIMG_13014 [Coccidioides immitis RS]
MLEPFYDGLGGELSLLMKALTILFFSIYCTISRPKVGYGHVYPSIYILARVKPRTTMCLPSLIGQVSILRDLRQPRPSNCEPWIFWDPVFSTEEARSNEAGRLKGRVKRVRDEIAAK